MPVPPEIIGPTTLALTQGIASFHTFIPSLSDIRKNNPADNPDFAADVRMGEVASVALTVGIGVIASSLTGSSVPALVSLVVALGLVVMYESVLRSDRPLETKG
jgi:hypothetical protein